MSGMRAKRTVKTTILKFAVYCKSIGNGIHASCTSDIQCSRCCGFVVNQACSSSCGRRTTHREMRLTRVNDRDVGIEIVENKAKF